jgi:hypothetical protein
MDFRQKEEVAGGLKDVVRRSRTVRNMGGYSRGQEAGTPVMDTSPLRWTAKTESGGGSGWRRPHTPRRRSSRGATLKRSYTVDGGRRGVPQFDGGDDVDDEVGKKGVGMQWLQRASERKGFRDLEFGSKDTVRRVRPVPREFEGAAGGREVLPLPLPGAVNVKKVRDRASTDPLGTVGMNDAREEELRRASSSGGYGNKVKQRIESFGFGRGNSIDEEREDEMDVKKKGWKKRVFSKDYFHFKTEAKAQKTERRRSESFSDATPPMPIFRYVEDSEGFNGSHGSRRSRASKISTDTAASQVASTVWQVDGMASYEEAVTKIPKHFDDSVIGMIDGKVGSMSTTKRSAQPWKPPMLNLDMQVVAEVDRLPVKIETEQEFWVAVLLQGRVIGDVDIPGSTTNAERFGLDVGVLLDISYDFYDFVREDANMQ